MHVAKTGLNAQQTRMQVVANNLANVNTTGFKRDRVNFESLLYQVLRAGGATTADGQELGSATTVGTGVKIVNTQKLFSQGSLMNTENSLDVAIDGAGFFSALMPDGRIGYTRNGAFTTNSQGTLVTMGGYIVQPEIQIPENVTSVMIAGEVQAQEVGQLQLTNFANQAGLQPIGETFLIETASSGPAIDGNPLDGGFGKLVQGYLESSNVNVVQQLVDMIETQRAYEVSSKAITGTDEMMRFISNNL
jgi:flagellar basal-body rod protein FlgG